MTRPWTDRLRQFLAAGAAGGFGATVADALLFTAPGREPMPASLPSALLLACQVYCLVGLFVGACSWGAIGVASHSSLSQASEPGSYWATRTDLAHHAAAIRAATWLLCLVGLGWSLGRLLEYVIPVATPLRRSLLLSLCGGAIAAAWLGVSGFISRSAFSLIRGLQPLVVPGLMLVQVAFVAIAWASLRDRTSQPLAAFFVVFGALAPFAAVALRPGWLGKWVMNALILSSAGVALSVALVGIPAQAHYGLAVARALPSYLLRERPVRHATPELAQLDREVAAHFQLRSSSGLRSRAPHPQRAEPGAPDILLLTIDTLRRDRVFRDAGAPVLMPALQAFASQAFSFRRAFAASGSTIASLSQLITGTREHTLGHIQAPTGAVARLDPTTDTVTETLSRAGYATRAVFGGTLFSYFPSFALGMDQVEERDEGGLPLSAEGVVSRILQALNESPGPLFLWGHIMEIHDYGFGPGDVAGRYDESVRRVDRELAKLFEGLARAPRGANTLVIITSDHGEAFGEGRMVAHAVCHALTLPIPLLIRFPNAPARVIDATVSHLDLAPTILVAAGLPIAHVGGRDLAKVQSARPWPRDYAFFEHAAYSLEATPTQLGVAAFPWLFIYDVRQRLPILIDLAGDPGGRVNRAGLGLAQEQVLTRLLLESLSVQAAGSRLQRAHARPEDINPSPPELPPAVPAIGRP